MPRYFIDTSDQEFFCRDDQGIECASLDEAKAVAVTALPDLAREALPDGDVRNFLAIVRDEHGQALLQASLALIVTSLTPTDHGGPPEG